MRNKSGDKGIRTPDPLRAKQVLSQLSYAPSSPFFLGICPPGMVGPHQSASVPFARLFRADSSTVLSGRQDSNLRPSVPKTDALPDCATPRNARS
jgi:hypothetical protein